MEIKLGRKGHLNTRNKFPDRFFLNPKISLSILDELYACPHTVFIRSLVLRNKPANLLLLGFEAQTKKPSQ
jgi:hypothetical protein